MNNLTRTQRASSHAAAILAVCAAIVAIASVVWVIGDDVVEAADDAPTLTASAAVRGWVDNGDHVVITAVVESTALFNGRLDVVTPSGAVVSRQLNVAGGTTKSVQVVVSTSPDLTPLQVRLMKGDKEVRSKMVTLRAADDVEIVGIMPAMAARIGKLPEQVKLATGAGNAQMAELPLEFLALGPSALDVYDTIVATSADLDATIGALQPSLLGWLNRGGILLIDDPQSSLALPPEWRPGNAGFSWAGRGEVRQVSGRASDGDWANLIVPTGLSPAENNMQFFPGQGSFELQRSLAARAGVTLPSLMPLLVPLAIYGVVVTVGLFIVLKLSKRMTLAWILIPVLAITTSGAVVAYGGKWRSTGSPAAAVFVDGYPGGGVAQLTLLTFSRSGGTTATQLPQGWQSDSETNPTYGSASVLRTVSSGDGTAFTVDLEPGEVAVATLTGPTAPSGLAIEARVSADGKRVDGTVTNRGSVALFDVAAFGSGGGKSLGVLAVGESKPFSVAAKPTPPGFQLADLAWPRVFDNNGNSVTAEGSMVEFGVWELASIGTNMYPSGMVRAAGWTSERAADAVELPAVTVETATAAIQPADSAVLHPATVRSTMARNPFGPFGNGTGDSIFRYTLPPSAQMSQALVIEVPTGLTSIELWNGTTWVKVRAIKQLARVPVGSVIDGTVLARAVNSGDFLIVDAIPQLRGAKAGEGQ